MLSDRRQAAYGDRYADRAPRVRDNTEWLHDLRAPEPDWAWIADEARTVRDQDATADMTELAHDAEERR